MQSLYFNGGDLRFVTDDEDGRRRLRDALGTLVQVHQLSVLVGSGASFHLGSPSIRKIDADLVLKMAVDAGLSPSGEVEALVRLLVPVDTDLEAFLGQLVAARAYGSAFGLSEVELSGKPCAVDDLEEIFKTVNIGLAWACDLPRIDPPLPPPYDNDPFQAHREFFRRLVGARRPDAARVKVFTTNYDTVIERALDDAGIHFFDGFVGRVRRSLEMTSYDQDLYTLSPTGPSALRRVHEVLHLYKIHGSLTWRAEARPGLDATSVVQTAGPPTESEIAVIYPTPSKELDVLGHPYSDFLRALSTALVQPECSLIAVGYGFADAHINRIIFDALSHNPTLQLLVSDPFGVVASGAAVTATGPIDRADTAVGRLSSIRDQRISVLTGSDAKFTELAMLFPDVAEIDANKRAELEAALAAALLPPTPRTGTGTP